MKRIEGRTEGPLYGPIVFGLAGALAAAGLALALLTLAAMVGPFRFLGGAPDSARVELALWLPPSALASPPGERMRRVRAWRAASGRDRNVQDVARLAQAAGRVVALPDARALSRREAAALEGFLREGGAAVLTGAVGVRDGDGSWRGWELMAALLDAPEIATRDAEASRTLTAARRGPLTAPLAPGRSIALHAEPGVPALADPDAELTWPDDGTRPAGASRRLQVGRGRLVWIAAGPESADEAVADQLFVGGEMPRLVDAAVAWAAREPTVEVLAWPEGRALGALLERDPGHGELSPAALAVTAGEREARRLLDREIARAGRTSELFVLAVPAGALADPLRAALFEHAGARLREGRAWFGERGDVAEWKRLRGGLVATIDRVGPQRRLIRVENSSRETLRGAVLRVYLNDAVHAALLQRTTLQQEEPLVRLDLGAERLDLLLPDLPGRARRAYTLDLESATEDA